MPSGSDAEHFAAQGDLAGHAQPADGRNVAANEVDSLGDTSTLAAPGVVDNLIDNRLNR